MNDPKDPKKKNGGRVYKDASDKERQKKMEGKSTPFQLALTDAERKGKKEFDFEGKKYASKPKPTPNIKKVENKSPSNTSASTPSVTPKKVESPKSTKEGPKKTEKILAKDITGKAKYLKRNKSTASQVAKRLKKRQKNKGY